MCTCVSLLGLCLCHCVSVSLSLLFSHLCFFWSAPEPPPGPGVISFPCSRSNPKTFSPSGITDAPLCLLPLLSHLQDAVDEKMIKQGKTIVLLQFVQALSYFFPHYEALIVLTSQRRKCCPRLASGEQDVRVAGPLCQVEPKGAKVQATSSPAGWAR